MAPVIQEITKRTGVEDIVAYNNTYDRMTPGMTELMALVRTVRLAASRQPGRPVLLRRRRGAQGPVQPRADPAAQAGPRQGR
jgi:hypothetical protein